MFLSTSKRKIWAFLDLVSAVKVQTTSSKQDINFVLLKCQEHITNRIFGLFLYQVRVTKGDETRTAVFKETIPEWPLSTWYSGESK